LAAKSAGLAANENNVALVKQGASSLTLSGLNSYTGSTTVSLEHSSLPTTHAEFRHRDNRSE